MDVQAIYRKPSETEIKELLEAKFGDRVRVTGTETRRVYADVDREVLHDVCVYLHDNLAFEHIMSVTGVDLVSNLRAVYHIDNYDNGCVIELNVDIPNDDPHVRTISDIWVGGNWHEREAWELFGIVFDGHSKLERLLTPDTYEFFPFRKSYKLRGQE
jgi:NADH-quinone oxidoreductase subunit C